VYDRGEWRLHFVCRHEIDPDPPDDGVAGIDLGISNIAAVSFGDNGVLYPGGALKEDEYWFQKERANCDDSASNGADRLDRKRTERRTHFLHALSKDIVTKCVERGVGTIVVGDLSGIRDGTDWGDHGNLALHGWAFDRFTGMLEYKAEAQGIDVEQVDERGTSKSCSVCGIEDGNQRVERGLYVCDSCGTVANADINGAENIRQKVLPSLASDGGDRDNGWMAQPAVRLFDRSEGCFAPREQVVDCKP
jgi:putative transposase